MIAGIAPKGGSEFRGGEVELLAFRREQRIRIRQCPGDRAQIGLATIEHAQQRFHVPAREIVEPCQQIDATGTTISAAPVGVGARMSAAWSISVQSVSCPTAATRGIPLSAAARTTISSLNPQRSSMEPPPRATIRTSGRGMRASRHHRVETADGRGNLRRAGFALDPDRPHQDMAGKAILQPVQDIADDRAGGRGHDADHARQIRQRPLAGGLEQPLGGELAPAFLQQRHERPDAGGLEAAR